MHAKLFLLVFYHFNSSSLALINSHTFELYSLYFFDISSLFSFKNKTIQKKVLSNKYQKDYMVSMLICYLK
jgi:hypothetical protein